MDIYATTVNTSLELRVGGHRPHSLSHSEVRQDIDSTAEERIKSNGAVVVFNEAAHSRLGQSATAKDLYGIACGLLSVRRRKCLQECNLAGIKR